MNKTVRHIRNCHENLTSLSLTSIVIFSAFIFFSLDLPIPFHYYARTRYELWYTADPEELGTTTPGNTGKYGFVYQGVMGKVYSANATAPNGTVPLLRYVRYHSQMTLYYTTLWRDIGTNIVGVPHNGWTLQGVACYIYPTQEPGTVVLHQYVHVQSWGYYYTIRSDDIGTTTVGATGHFGFKYDGIRGYVFPS